MNKKGDIQWDELVSWLIAALVIVVVGALIFVLYHKGGSAISYIKGLLGRA